MKTISAKDSKSRKFSFKACSYTGEREQGREKVTEGVTDTDGKSFAEAPNWPPVSFTYAVFSDSSEVQERWRSRLGVVTL